MKGTPPFTCISTVIYTCDKEYWLLGSETLRCRIDGRWDNVKPICVNKGWKYVEYLISIGWTERHCKEMFRIYTRRFMSKPNHKQVAFQSNANQPLAESMG